MSRPLQLPLVIVEDPTQVFDGNHYTYPPEYDGHFDRCLISASEIRRIVKALAAAVYAHYNGRRPVMLCTLKGACQFFIHLLDELQEMRFGYDIEFARAKSYEGTSTTGCVKILGELNVDSIKGRHVLIVEDIVDTGTTLAHLLPMLNDVGKPASIEVVTLLDKRLDIPEDKKFQAKYVGFSIPNRFLVGYGLDYNELYRDLKDIFVISKKGIDFDHIELSI